MSWIALAAAAVTVIAAALLVAGPWSRRRRLRMQSTARILFPFVGTSVSRSTLDAALRLARADSATLVPAYVATVPMQLSLEAPIPRECEAAMPLLEAIERRATRLEVPIDSRIERGRTPRHALTQLIEHESFDRIVIPAQTSRSDGFEPDDIAWLLEHAPGEVVVLRPGNATNGAKSRPTAPAASPGSPS
jgi:hypothetical protein